MLTIAVCIAGLIALLFLYRWTQQYKLAERKWVDEVLNKKLEEAVWAQMGTAHAMKVCNGGKLTSAERKTQRDMAISAAIRNTFPITDGRPSVEFGDLDNRVATFVNTAKMAWNHSGMHEAEQARALLEMTGFPFHKRNSGEDDDED